MIELSREIRSATVASGTVRLWWLGQAGFAFKTSDGRVTLVDPYLSDAVERLAGFKRLSLSPVSAEDVPADWVVLSHEHEDHLDPDALPVIASRNPACRFAVPAGCAAGLTAAGVDEARRVNLNLPAPTNLDCSPSMQPLPITATTPQPRSVCFWTSTASACCAAATRPTGPNWCSRCATSNLTSPFLASTAGSAT